MFSLISKKKNNNYKVRINNCRKTMPRPTKLHSKQKSTTIQKTISQTTNDEDSTESMQKFQLELCWCIQQMEKQLNEKSKLNEKQLQETWKILTTLKSNNQPMVRKRQLMRTHFGDYRAKMAAEEKKLVKLANNMKITESPNTKATFLRKSAFSSTGDSAFKFNFNVQPESEAEIMANIVKEDSCIDKDCNVINTDSSINKKFKFTFTDNQFKFNFSVTDNKM